MRPNLADALQLMLVTDDRIVPPADLLARCVDAAAGGVTSIQVRLKHGTPRALLALTEGLLERVGIPVLVNDRPDVAAAARAAGVHLGPDDVPPSVARAACGAGVVVGASVGTDAEADRLERDAGAVDYWGIGPWRATDTKPGAGQALGGAGTRALAARAGARPFIVIGGVRPDDLASVRALHAAGVAVVSGILGAADAAGAAAGYRRAWAEARGSAPG